VVYSYTELVPKGKPETLVRNERQDSSKGECAEPCDSTSAPEDT